MNSLTSFALDFLFFIMSPKWVSLQFQSIFSYSKLFRFECSTYLNSKAVLALLPSPFVILISVFNVKTGRN